MGVWPVCAGSGGGLCALAAVSNFSTYCREQYRLGAELR